MAWRRRVRERRGGEDAGGCRGDGDFQYHGRGILADSHRASLRSFHNSPSVEALISQCDFTLVAGSRLRSNETRSWTLELPTPRVQIDIDPAAASRNYLMDNTPVADCRALLAALAARVQGRIWGDARWDSQLKEAVEAAEQGLRDQCGDYAKLNDAIAQALPDDGIRARYYRFWQPVGSRLFRAHGPLMNIHSLPAPSVWGYRWRWVPRLPIRNVKWSARSATAA